MCVHVARAHVHTTVNYFFKILGSHKKSKKWGYKESGTSSLWWDLLRWHWNVIVTWSWWCYTVWCATEKVCIEHAKRAQQNELKCLWSVVYSLEVELTFLVCCKISISCKHMLISRFTCQFIQIFNMSYIIHRERSWQSG